MTQNLPTFVFVPGAGHGPDTWDKVTAILEGQQYRCISITLPSTLGSADATFPEDIQAARDPIEAEIAQGRDVVVVVHSYGGVVGQSAVKGLTSSIPGSGRGRVLGFAMMATGFAVTGKSFLGSNGGKPPPSWHIDDKDFAIIDVDPRQLFYHDLSDDEAAFWTSKLRKQAVKALRDDGEYGYAGWQDVPSWFLATQADKALPVEAQRLFIQAAKDAGGDVMVREIESSHSPMLSRPEETAAFILDAAAAFTGHQA